MSSSNPAGCRFEETATERFSQAASTSRSSPSAASAGTGKVQYRPRRSGRAQDSGDGFGDGVVGPVPAEQHAKVLQGEPGDVEAGFDGLLAEGFEQERFGAAGESAYDQVLPASDPFQGA